MYFERYLGNDMQFYVLAPLVLIPFASTKKLFNYIAYGLSSLCLIIHVVTNAVFTSNFLPSKAYFDYKDIMRLYGGLEFLPW